MNRIADEELQTRKVAAEEYNEDSTYYLKIKKKESASIGSKLLLHHSGTACFRVRT